MIKYSAVILDMLSGSVLLSCPRLLAREKKLWWRSCWWLEVMVVVVVTIVEVVIIYLMALLHFD